MWATVPWPTSPLPTHAARGHRPPSGMASASTRPKAADVLLTAAFDDCGLDEVVAVADPAERRMTRVLEKAGMQQARNRHTYGRPHALYLAKRSGWRANAPAHASEQK